MIKILIAIACMTSLATAADAPMPDPLIMNNGTRVTTPGQWRQRREEMKAILQKYLLGVAPPPPGNMTGEVIKSQMVLDGAAKFQLVRLSFGAGSKLGFEAAIYLPAKGEGPFPFIVHPAFYPTPGSKEEPVMPTTFATTAAATRAAAGREWAMRFGDPEVAARENFSQALDRGYGIIAAYYQQWGRDQKVYRDSAFFPAYPQNDWADLAAWAWGMSRCVDYLETQPYADKTKLIALGHSRLGKCTLVAGAMDERFAMVAPAGSGCAGTGAFRFNGKTRGGKEGLEEVLKNFPQWISPNMQEFSGNVEKMPFDQHWLIALCAPRPFIAADALGDPYCNGNALKESWLAARPVYEFLGVKEKLGIHFRPGGHELAKDDWKVILDFADRELRGVKSDQQFDQMPAVELLH